MQLDPEALSSKKHNKGLLCLCACLWVFMKQDTANYKFIKQQHRGTSQSNPVLNLIDKNRKTMVYHETPWCEKDVRGEMERQEDFVTKAMVYDPGETNCFRGFQPATFLCQKSDYNAFFLVIHYLLNRKKKTQTLEEKD